MTQDDQSSSNSNPSSGNPSNPSSGNGSNSSQPSSFQTATAITKTLVKIGSEAVKSSDENLPSKDLITTNASPVIGLAGTLIAGGVLGAGEAAWGSLSSAVGSNGTRDSNDSKDGKNGKDGKDGKNGGSGGSGGSGGGSSGGGGEPDGSGGWDGQLTPPWAG
jgi:hypothetical protein